MCPCCLSLFLTVLVETLIFVGQWLQRVLDVAYLWWRASRTSALSSRPVVARLLPERCRSFTSPGFSLCLLSIHCSLWYLHCLGNVRYCSPRCFHPNDLPSLADGTFPHDEVKLTGHKKLTFGVAKVVLVSTLLFKDYMVNFTHFCRTCYQVYTYYVVKFSGSHSMSNTIKNKFGRFLQELFSRGVYMERMLTYCKYNQVSFSCQSAVLNSLRPSDACKYMRCLFNNHGFR